MRRPVRRSLSHHALAAAILCALTLPLAVAHAEDASNASPQNARQLSTVEVKARALPSKHAPTHASLKATQPQSVIGRNYIENAQSPAANYSDIVAIAPSVVDIEPNGPGLANSKGLSIRGFQDGQYNLTWDGIPVGDANDFTHHSAEYFMPQDLGSVSLDRGPGNASTVGFATFGGTIGLHTKDPLPHPQTTLYGALGSYGTHLAGAEFDTGVMHDYGDLSAFIDVRGLSSNGALSGATLDRKNVFAKAVKPLGEHTTLTVVAMANRNTGGNAAIVGATSYPYVAVDKKGGPWTSPLPGQMQIFGPGYDLSGNPQSQAYTGYNYDDFDTDFGYIGLQSDLGGVHIDNKLYTYAYYHDGWNGLDPNGGGCDHGQINCLTPDGTFPAKADTPNGTVYGANDIPGQQMYLRYRNWGDLLRMSQKLGPGALLYGVWFNRQLYHRYQAEIDLSNNDAFNATPPGAAIDRYINGTFTVWQPYLQYDWAITSGTTLSAGLKYARFTRHDDAPIQQKVKKPLNYQQTWSKLLPALELHQMIDDHWSAYAQVAKGYLAPNENLFYVPDPGQSTANVVPEQTTNYQLGTVYSDARLNLQADVYRINFSNMVTSVKIAGVSYFQNLGGTTYKGAEIEGSYLLGAGFSLYANASYNKATQNSSGLQLKKVPTHTFAAGLLYRGGHWEASLLAKSIGARWGDYGTAANGSTVGIYRLPALTVANAAVHYRFGADSPLPRGSRIGLQIFNLTDTRKLDDLAGYTAGKVPLFYAMTGRSIMASFSVPFR
jgi:iron complex outermembrane receptor protein